jgi:hypothetical protein
MQTICVFRNDIGWKRSDGNSFRSGCFSFEKPQPRLLSTTPSETARFGNLKQFSLLVDVHFWKLAIDAVLTSSSTNHGTLPAA